MPILDIDLVQPDGAAPPVAALTQALADAAGHVFGSAPAHVTRVAVRAGCGGPPGLWR